MHSYQRPIRQFLHCGVLGMLIAHAVQQGLCNRTLLVLFGEGTCETPS